MELEMETATVRFISRFKKKEPKREMPLKLKLTVVGDKQVGKSSLIQTYIHDQFHNETDMDL